MRAARAQAVSDRIAAASAERSQIHDTANVRSFAATKLLVGCTTSGAAKYRYEWSTLQCQNKHVENTNRIGNVTFRVPPSRPAVPSGNTASCLNRMPDLLAALVTG